MKKEDRRFLYLISRSVSRLKYYSIQRFQSEGVTVTPSQMGILFLLSGGADKTMSELSSALGLDNSTLTRLADKLENEGLVVRTRDNTDRRISKLSITDKGTAEGHKALKITKEINREIIKGFSDSEVEAFVKILKSFIEKF